MVATGKMMDALPAVAVTAKDSKLPKQAPATICRPCRQLQLCRVAAAEPLNVEDGLVTPHRGTRPACMEATGGYEQKLALALADAGFNVAVVNPRRMRRLADASGKLAKTDRIDARVNRPLRRGDEPTALAKARSRSGRDQRTGGAPPAAG